MNNIFNIAQKYGLVLSDSDVAMSNETWDEARDIDIVMSGRLY